jgi:pimeloyl-ACP methyl ester carboxylesterase
MKAHSQLRRALLIVILLVLAGCDLATKPEEKDRGDIISHELMGDYRPVEIQQALALFGLPPSLQPQFGVEVYRIVYQTLDQYGDDHHASGVVLVPERDDGSPLLSLQHGSALKRDNVASDNIFMTTEGITGLLMAALGYTVSAPDYLGFGESDVIHPYLHGESLSQATIDFIRAAQKLCGKKNHPLNGQLFLTGYSEGGYVTLATQKAIEESYSDEFDLTAVAPLAGPYDLIGTFESILQAGSYAWPAYLAFAFIAYDDIYGWNRLAEIFNSPYHATLPELLDGTHTFAEVNSQLPVAAADLLRPDFITAYLNGNEVVARSAFGENGLLDWQPIAPIRLFHGDADETVPYQNALSVIENLASNGSTDIELITVAGADHITAGLPSVLGALDWFNSLVESPLIANIDQL